MDFYKNGVFFALIADGALYFKVDDNTRRDYEKRGSRPFQYSAKNRGQVTLSYWELPAEIIDDRDELKRWVERAVRAK